MSEIKIRAKSVIKLETPGTNLTTEWQKGAKLKDMLDWILTMYLISRGHDEPRAKAEEITGKL